VFNAAIAVNTTPTNLTPPGCTTGTNWRTWIIQNLGPQPIYIGGPTVTTANGQQLGPGETWSSPSVIAGLHAITTTLQTAPADTRIIVA
jgi:hypothetical protein